MGHSLPEKRTIDYRPRMGRRSNENESQKGYEPKPYDVFFTPRMGKRSDVLSNNVSPFGRSMFTGKTVYMSDIEIEITNRLFIFFKSFYNLLD